MAVSNVELRVNASGATRSLRNVQNQTVQLQRSFGGLQTQVARVASAIALVGASRFVFFKTAELETQRKSLEVLTGSVKDTNKIIKELQEFGAVTPFTSSQLIEQTKRLKAFGFETEELVDTTKRLSEVAGATGADLEGIATAFGQIRAKGKLQQEENLQLLERGVDITSELEKLTNKQGEAFASAMRKGEIGADLVNQALINLTNEGGAFFGGATAQATTLNGKLSTLQDSFDTLGRTVGQVLSPALKTAITAFSDLTLSTSNFLQTSEGKTALIFTGVAFAVKGVVAANVLLKASLTVLTAKFAATNAGAIALAKAQATASLSTKALAIATGGLSLALSALPLVAIAGGFAFLTNAIIKAINKQKEFNELLDGGSVEEFKSKIKETEKEISTLEEKIAKITKNQGDFVMVSGAEAFEVDLKRANDQLKELKKGLEKAEELSLANEFKTAAKNIHEQKKGLEQIIERSKIRTEEGKIQFDIEQRRLELQKEFGVELGNELLKKELALKPLQKQVDKIKESEEAAKRLSEAFKKIGDDIATGVSDALTDAIMQTKSLAEVANALLNDIARQLLRLGVNTLLSSTFGGIFKSLPTFATGGRPTVGQPSIVGEKGPELFVPSRAGTIIPNNQLGGGSMTNNIVVNVDVSGGVDAQGGEQEGRELGRLIAVAVQSEIIQQKRAGGLLA